MKNKLSYSQRVKNEIRENKASFYVYSILNILVITSIVRQFYRGEYESLLYCFLALLLLLLPGLVQARFRMELPVALEISIYMFIFAGEILGEVNSFYVLIPHWDTVLHTICGFLAAAIGCSLILLLNHNPKLTFTLSPMFVAVTAFCFSMTIGVVWEFWEYAMDTFFAFDTQKDTIISSFNSVHFDETMLNKIIALENITETQITLADGTQYYVNGYLDIGIIDTMKDLFVNFIGALVFSFIGYFYAKTKGQGKIAKSFMPYTKD